MFGNLQVFGMATIENTRSVPRGAAVVALASKEDWCWERNNLS